jgi:hypothetical protein
VKRSKKLKAPLPAALRAGSLDKLGALPKWTTQRSATFNYNEQGVLCKANELAVDRAKIPDSDGLLPQASALQWHSISASEI